MTGGGNLPAKNNYLDNFWYDNDLTPVNNCADYGCIVDTQTVFNVSYIKIVSFFLQVFNNCITLI